MGTNILSEDVLNNFLVELEKNNPGITAKQENLADIQRREAAELEAILPGENITSNDAWGWARNNNERKEVTAKQFEPALRSVALASARASKRISDIAKKEALADKKRRKQEILIEAINSTFIDLNTPLTVEHKKLLIVLLTKHYAEKMEHHRGYINAAIEMAFKKAIPNDLINAYNKFPDAVAPFPGFTYQASKEYGQGLQFKVSLKLPLYFKPEDCTSILKEMLPIDRLASIDKAVAFFHKYKEARIKREVKIAEILTKITTFFQLVKKDPFWYDVLVQELKCKQCMN